MNQSKNSLHFLLAVIVTIALLLPATKSVSAGSGSASDLISAVNSYRSSYGYSTLNVDYNLMAAAQSQADYLAATYIMGSGANGHVGAGGSNASDRAYAFGYGSGKAITVSENWVGSAVLSASELPTCEYWADSAHQNTMLDGWGTSYQDIGVGVATSSEGVSYYVMDVGVIDETEKYSPSNNTYVDPGVVNGTAQATYVYSGLVTSTPNADGSIVHVVKYGETLLSIATAYGVTVDQIRELNYMDEGWTAIFEEEELLIKAKTSTSSTAVSGTGTPTADVTATATNAPTYTPRAAVTRTSMPVVAITVMPSPTPTPAPGGFSSQTLGIGLVILCGLGLLGVIGSGFIKRG
jgi:uncharacterized protein YkwD